jgi:hypothetical protein
MPQKVTAFDFVQQMHKKLGTSELHFINTIDQCTEQYGKYK